jgi:hypothetical protein
MTAVTLRDLRGSLIAAVALTACGPSTDSQPELRATPRVEMVGDTAFVELPLGRSADNGEISITFEAVTEDSRCPRGVQCMWEGNASVRLTLESGDETQVVILGSTVEPRKASFAGYAIGLRQVMPYPLPEWPVEPESYWARIAILDTR